MESSNMIDQKKIYRQDMQYIALAEALENFLNNLGSALDNFASKLSKSVDDKTYKWNSAQTWDSLKTFIGIGKTLVPYPLIPMEREG